MLDRKKLLVNMPGSLYYLIIYKSAIVPYIEGTSTCGTSHGSDVPIYLLVMMDGKSMMPRPKKPAKVGQALCCNVLSRPLLFCHCCS